MAVSLLGTEFSTVIHTVDALYTRFFTLHTQE